LTAGAGAKITGVCTALLWYLGCMFILYTIVDKCNHCSLLIPAALLMGFFNSLNKVFIIYMLALSFFTAVDAYILL
jgi:hypothetical protein